MQTLFKLLSQVPQSTDHKLPVGVQELPPHSSRSRLSVNNVSRLVHYFSTHRRHPALDRVSRLLVACPAFI